MVQTQNAAIEVLPQKLVFAPGQQVDTGVVDGLALCANEDGVARGYAVAHYSKSACGRAFGPVDLDQTIRFCRELDRLLKLRADKDEPLHVTSTPFDEAAHTNVVVLIGAYLIFNLGWTVESLTQTLGEAAAARPLPCAWAQAITENIMKVRHCWLGCKAAQEHQWIDQECFSDDVHASLVCGKYIEFSSTYDAAWVVPGRIFLCADPITVVADPNPCTFTELWPRPRDELAEHSPVSPISPGKWREHTPVTPISPSPGKVREHGPGTPIAPGGFEFQVVEPPRSQPMEPPLVATPSKGLALSHASEGSQSLHVEVFTDKPTAAGPVEQALGEEVSPPTSLKRMARPPAISIPGKEFRTDLTTPSQLEIDPMSPGGRTDLDSTATVCKDYSDVNRHRLGGSDGSKSLPFFALLQELDIKTVVRANYLQETGMQTCSYDKKKVKEIGLRHVDLPYPDYQGAVPPAGVLAKLLRASRSDDAICVHCKGGFGRSGVYACCIAIDKFDVSGEAMLGWVRIARPGAITTPEQEAFLCSFTGRTSLHELTASAAGCCVVH